MIFETHAHYDDERFTEDQESVLADLPRKGISPRHLRRDRPQQLLRKPQEYAS